VISTRAITRVFARSLATVISTSSITGSWPIRERDLDKLDDPGALEHPVQFDKPGARDGHP